MRTLLLTAVLSGLVSALQAQQTLALLAENKNLTGTWYMNALVKDVDVIESDIISVAFPVKVTSLDGGNMEVTVVVLIDDKCHEFTSLLEKTEEPGTFTTAHGIKHISIYEMAAKEHYIFLAESKTFGIKFHVVQLIGRDKQANLEALEEFIDFIQLRDLGHEELQMPEQREKCIDQSQAAPQACVH